MSAMNVRSLASSVGISLALRLASERLVGRALTLGA
jgi:hypothetical protein